MITLSKSPPAAPTLTQADIDVDRDGTIDIAILVDFATVWPQAQEYEVLVYRCATSGGTYELFDTITAYRFPTAFKASTNWYYKCAIRVLLVTDLWTSIGTLSSYLKPSPKTDTVVAPSSLAVTARPKNQLVEVSASLESDYKETIFYRGTSATVSTHTEIGRVSGTVFVDTANLTSGTSYYYSAAHVDTSGNVSAKYPTTTSGAGQTAVHIGVVAEDVEPLAIKPSKLWPRDFSNLVSDPEMVDYLESWSTEGCTVYNQVANSGVLTIAHGRFKLEFGRVSSSATMYLWSDLSIPVEGGVVYDASIVLDMLSAEDIYFQVEFYDVDTSGMPDTLLSTVDLWHAISIWGGGIMSAQFTAHADAQVARIGIKIVQAAASTITAAASSPVVRRALAAGSVGTTHIADNAITAAKIAADAVGSSEIASGAVGTAELADDSITAAKIAAGAVGTSELADAGVTNAKLASNSVDSSQIVAGAVTNTKIASGTIQAGRLSTGEAWGGLRWHANDNTTVYAFGTDTTVCAFLHNAGLVRASRDGNAAAEFQRLTSNGTVVNFFRGTNNPGSISVTTTATTYNTSSDYRLKYDIEPMVTFEVDGEDAEYLYPTLRRVMAARPVTFRFYADEEDESGNKPLNYGFIAHELQEMFPQAVSGVKDGEVAIGTAWVAQPKLLVREGTRSVDEDGNITITPDEYKDAPDEVLKDVTEAEAREHGAYRWEQTSIKPIYQGVDHSMLVPSLMAAVQELTLLVLEQRKSLQHLENKLKRQSIKEKKHE